MQNWILLIKDPEPEGKSRILFLFQNPALLKEIMSISALRPPDAVGVLSTSLEDCCCSWALSPLAVCSLAHCCCWGALDPSASPQGWRSWRALAWPASSPESWSWALIPGIESATSPREKYDQNDPPEPIFVTVYLAKESIPRHRFREPL
jgi:hypothetical protein